jgi:putative heme-binding domain-containing protein
LYVCDWLNPVIGHYQASYRDPRRDRSHGRIWRVTAKGRPLVKRLNFAEMSETELIGKLESNERWERDVAKFTLYRRPEKEVMSAVQAALLAKHSGDEMRQLYELSGVLAAHEQVEPGLVARLLASSDFRYRAWGVHLIGVWADRLERPLELLTKAMSDEHPRVRLEAVVACSWMPPQWAAQAVKVASLVLEKPTDAPINYALTQCIHALAKFWQPALAAGKLDFGSRFHALARVLTTVGDTSLTVRVKELLTSGNLSAGARDSLLTVLIENGSTEDADFAIAQGPDSQAVMDALVAVAWRKRDAGYGAVLSQLVNSPHRAARIAGCRIVAASGQDFGTGKRIHELLADATAASSERAAALAAVAKLRGKAALAEILNLAASTDSALRMAALAAAAPMAPSAVATRSVQLLVEAKAVADLAALLNPLLSQQGGADALAKALLEAQPSAETARLALQWMAEVGRDDAPVRKALNAAAGITSTVPDYSEALVKRLVADALAQGDSKRGEPVFRAAQATCMACHKLGNEGGMLGPDLSAIGRAMTPEAIVESVLWPKRQVKEGFLLTQISTKNGQALQGYKANETDQVLTLKDLATNTNHTITKSEISSRNDAGTLMPEGLTSWMTDQQRRDLLRYLFQLGK